MEDVAGDGMVEASQHTEVVSYMFCSASSNIMLKLVFLLLILIIIVSNRTNVVLHGN